VISEANTLVNEQTVMVEFAAAVLTQLAMLAWCGLYVQAGLAEIW
jgi:hypothetical protein